MSIKDLFDANRPRTNEVLREGAATDGAQAEGDLAGLPRVLRYALTPNSVGVGERVAADAATLAPHLSETMATWASTFALTGWQATAAALDDAAVRLDEPVLRAIADVVRMLSMRTTEVLSHREDALRVIAALTAGAREAPDFLAEQVATLARIDLYVVGWTHLASGARSNTSILHSAAHAAALVHGREATFNLIADTEQSMQAKIAMAGTKSVPDDVGVGHDTGVGSPHRDMDHLVVCPALGAEAAGRTKDIVRRHEHVIGKALPLAAMPDVAAVRRELTFEYPYATSEVDRLLSPLVGRGTVHLPPTIVVGPPGSGKSRLMRRLAEELGVTCWRADGSRADGNVFGGTDRRWSSVEACHPFLAVSRARTANPIILVDEVDKAGTRTDHGRLWDALLPFLEQETASAYPDPALQIDLNLSAVSVVMTANSIAGLPAPLVDRCRVIEFPAPAAGDLAVLLPALVRDHARDLGLDPRWVEPLDQDEAITLKRLWRGGSVRRLRALLDVLLRGRERLRPVQ